jgi:hypothetical protein
MVNHGKETRGGEEMSASKSTTTKKPAATRKPSKPKEQNEITSMGEVLQSLGNALDQVGGCWGLGRLGFDTNSVSDYTMGISELLDHMARNNIRFCVKETR